MEILKRDGINNLDVFLTKSLTVFLLSLSLILHLSLLFSIVMGSTLQIIPAGNMPTYTKVKILA